MKQNNKLTTSGLNTLTRMLDIILIPFMWIVGGLTKPLQETHLWHLKKWNWNSKALIVSAVDTKARFSHDVPFLFHTPIFGGLTKYVVIEAVGFANFWYIGWENAIHILKIKQNRIMLLVGKKGFLAYGLGDNGRELKLKVVGYGKLGDCKFEGLRLF